MKAASETIKTMVYFLVRDQSLGSTSEDGLPSKSVSIETSIAHFSFFFRRNSIVVGYGGLQAAVSSAMLLFADY